MATGHIRQGETFTYTNATGSAIAAGTVIEFTDMIGVALGDIANGASGEVAVEEVWELAKETGVAFTQGQQLYWDATNNRLDATNTNIPAGKAAAAAASAATTAQVKLNA